MKYCLTTTTSHEVALKFNNCIEEINSLIETEGYDGVLPLFTNKEIVINMDMAEALVSADLKRQEKNRSMDLAFGISDPDNSSKKQMLMVELKFNMKEFYGLRKQHIEDKVAGSAAILADSPPIYRQYIFIFNASHLQEAISRMYRMVPKIKSNYVAFDIDSLKSRFFY
jgi:hypothetical protein